MEWVPGGELYHPEKFRCQQDAYHTIIINWGWSVSGIIYAFLGLSVFWKVYIQCVVAPNSTGGEICCLYKDTNKNQYLQNYIDYLLFHTGDKTMHW